MKKFLLLLLNSSTYIFSFAQANDFRNPVIDVQRYSFQIKLTDADDHIEGNATITVKFLSDQPRIAFDLTQKNANGKGMEVVSVTENEQPLHFEQSNNILSIQLTQAAKASELHTYSVIYRGIPADGMIISKSKFGKRTFFADNWPNRAHNWLPCNDHPSDKAQVEFMVTAPSQYQVVGNGLRMEETNVDASTKFTHWKEDVAIPTKVMAIGAAEFAVHLSGNIDCIPVYSWVFPENRKAGFSDYDLATEVLPFYIKNVGPYPYKKLANVQSKTIFGGMENANTIFYDQNTVKGDGKTVSLLAHEIAHQWFGNSATETHFSHLWLSEGFATYMTDAFLENKYGLDTLNKEMIQQRKQVVDFYKKRQTPVVDTTTTDYMILLNPNSYEKGGWVLHMLRRKLGDSIFWKSVSTYYKTYAGKNASSADLERIFESVSGQSLEVFFRQWIYTAGHPQLNINWTYNAAKKSVDLTIEQTQKNLFEFPMDFEIVKGSEHVVKTVTVSGKNTTANIPFDGKPGNIIADPRVQLLYEGTIMQH